VPIAIVRRNNIRTLLRLLVVVFLTRGAAHAAGATVAGHGSDSAPDSFTVTTDATGKAQDYSDSSSAPAGSQYVCNVDSASKSGWQYNASANKQTSNFAIVP
jgi:hypothetical protein